MQFFQKISLRRKQTLIILLTTSVALLLACAAFIAYDTITFRRELSERVTILADAIGNNCAAAIDFNDPKTAEETLAGLRADGNITSACVYPRDGTVFAVYHRDDTTEFAPPPAQASGQEFTQDELHLFRPIKQGGELAGTIFVASDLNGLSSRLVSYVVIVAGVFLASLLGALLLSHRLQRLVSDPIVDLAQVARTVAQEKNYSLRATKQSTDEIGQLVDGFNEMLAQIQTRDAALQAARDHLEARVAERTRDAANSQALYQSLVDQMPAGVFRKDWEGRYVFVNAWFCTLKGVASGRFLGKTPTEVAASEIAKPEAKYPEIMRDTVTAAQGANNHTEILQTGRSIEVEENYPGPDGKIHYLSVVKSPVFDAEGKIVGSQGMLFDITERKQAEAELSYERDLLRELLDYSPDPIYFKDARSHFLKAGKVLARLCGARDAAELVGKTDFDFFTDQHARMTFADEQEIIRTGRPLIGKMEKEVLKDGRESWALTSKMPLRNKAGEIIGTFGISKDITVIKQTEARLEEVHKQLLDASRQAGMAEIATNVLHNVGNVLNSVNVSASLVVNSVKKSQVAGLARVVTLLRDHEHDLGTFVTSDSRGRHLPVYLAQLSEHLLADQAATVLELDSLLKNIEHIKEIVAMQQSYARVSGVREIINLCELAEAALRMNAGALTRHGVNVTREFADIPPINVDKHRVLQVLVNLIRNAKYACEESPRTDKQVTVRVAGGARRVQIAVIDNGIGISPENLTRIFNHGFTTRKEGHGFGLHSGALAAKEMGGSLTVHSAGPGRGATFILDLPGTANEDHP
jgi:PAS domain S-box-containing protein